MKQKTQQKEINPRGLTSRERIVSIIKKSGEARAEDIAEILSVTPMAARQHLYKLEEDGTVKSESRAAGRGRPSKYWRLTDRADVYFPDAHRDLSLDLLTSVRSVFGDSGLNALVQDRSEKQQLAYKTELDTFDTLDEKMKALVTIRTREGYMAETVKGDDGTWYLDENHCPICAAAKICSGLCASELEIFRTLFKGYATVERSEHITQGARRCRYIVTAQ